jgi:hypothetical protein
MVFAMVISGSVAGLRLNKWPAGAAMPVAQAALTALGLLLLSPALGAADSPFVSFDVPAIVVAEPVNPAVVEAPLTGGELMRLRIPLSVIVSPGFAGTVDEYLIDIRSPGQTMRVIDLWPRNELYTDVEGSIAVESATKTDSNFSFALSAAYEPLGRGNASGNYHKATNAHERFQRKPPMQILTSSGTSHRGYGVFFKFRPGPVPVLEGSREVAVLFEVPRGWRGDLLQVSMRAVGRTAASSQAGKQLGSSLHWLSTHREGDLAAAAQAQRFGVQEQQLRSMARQMEKQVEARANPNMWRKIGSALDVVPPRIPNDYLSRFVFGPANARFSDGMQHLPVDLRVAALDYWEQRERVLSMAVPSQLAAPRVTAKVAAN